MKENVGLIWQKSRASKDEEVVRHDNDLASAGLVWSPLCCLESCFLDTASRRCGNLKQGSNSRLSTDMQTKIWGGFPKERSMDW